MELDEWIPMIDSIPRDCWLLVGNKLDEGQNVTEDDMQDKAADLGIGYCITSAKDGTGMDRLIELISARFNCS